MDNFSSHQNIQSPLVSVCIQTYQHKDYIKDALDSVIMQETDFQFEILIGEDESTDGTREICIEYAKQCSDKIRLFLNSRKNVIHINGQPTGRWNFINNIKNAKGKYIALLPGDDYWTDPHKLQKQVDLLESRPDASMCHHDVLVARRQGIFKRFRTYPRKVNWPSDAGPMAFVENIPQTASIVACTELVKKAAPIITRCSVGDRPLVLLLAQEGPVLHLGQPMSVYRVHEGGITCGAKPKERARRLVRVMMELLDLTRSGSIDHHLEFKLLQVLENRVVKWLCVENFNDRDFKELKGSLTPYFNEQNWENVAWKMKKQYEAVHRLRRSEAYRTGLFLSKSFKCLITPLMKMRHLFSRS